MTDLTKSRVLVTGCCGTIGNELVRQLVETFPVGELIGIDNNESELFFLEQRFAPAGIARFFLGDVRDHEKLSRAMRGVDIVFHVAAFKHVILCERSPMEAVQTNILGMSNVIQAATDNGVEKVIFTSSDKAVNPTSVMGTSKLMGERLMTAANSNRRGNGPVFASTRFGNVLGSRGSVVPIFTEQIKKGGPVTLTDDKMTRFIMSIPQAVRMVIDSASMAQGGEVFITKMPVIRIRDLAEVMIRLLAPQFGYKAQDIPIEIIGMKPGEKLYEELMSHEETRRSQELTDYFAVVPAFRSLYEDISYEYEGVVSNSVDRPYISAEEALMSQNEIERFLLDNNLLELPFDHADHPDERYWP
ncbi:polysaccharide biosynthesis protein [Desulfovibrio ferrophilus]|uniref:UDP-glucose 4-epimerase CapD2 n=1 Tax=Desulfovibrio ferrophilus TaxID=241368 RepID=A0A2Z6B2A1_9BACT|nr:polysaccharide biosynthesis protein [Desulfovibrio ferrophilus]BBD09568.1 UDP-glucose 4-epimerase CapD2 [Desulfovibrio ferrophilus]